LSNFPVKGGAYFTIEEFTSVTGACVISNEEQNWFVVTGGQVNTTGSPVLEFCQNKVPL